MVPTLTTERLVLRGFRESDLDALAAMQANPNVMRFLGATGAVRSRAESWTGMAVLSGQWLLKGFGLWAWQERATGRFVGRGGMLDLFGWPEPELAYALDEPFWGQGFAEEACRAALAWWWADASRERLASFIKPGNAPSCRLAARLGAVHEGMSELLGTPCELWVHRRTPTAFA
jgi:RimJ/RimL family protein N-acetyltransferase